MSAEDSIPQMQTREGKKYIDITIEEAKPEHVEGIQEVFYRTWLDTYPNKEAGITIEDIEARYKGRNGEERLAKRRADIINLESNKKYFVALDGKTVVGLCRVEKNEKENRLNAIYVLPEYQAQGIGKRLWHEAQTFFDPSKDTYLGVATYNQKAIDFYSKLGFRDTGKRYTDEWTRMESGAVLPEMDMVLRAT